MKLRYRIMIVSIVIVAALLAGGVTFVNQRKFGKLPSGARLERIRRSPNYVDGHFQNLSHTPTFTSDRSMISVMLGGLFLSKSDVTPRDSVPAVKTDLTTLPDNSLVWFGHSAYLIRLGGLNILVDPALETVSPIPSSIRPFPGADIYRAEDMPEIDLLIITHDHWDHLDYETIRKIKDRVGKVIVPLGVGEHFEYWSFDPERIVEMDWMEEHELSEGWRITTLPARHRSGRGLVQTKTLWASYMISSPECNIYVAGDGGYDDFYHDIARKFPEIDLAILENGQYSDNWKHIHLLPSLLPKVVEILAPRQVLTVHHSKYSLSQHPWDEPLRLARESADREGFDLLTPIIGEVVPLPLRP